MANKNLETMAKVENIDCPGIAYTHLGDICNMGPFEFSEGEQRIFKDTLNNGVLGRHLVDGSSYKDAWTNSQKKVRTLRKNYKEGKYSDYLSLVVQIRDAKVYSEEWRRLLKELDDNPDGTKMQKLADQIEKGTPIWFNITGRSALDNGYIPSNYQIANSYWHSKKRGPTLLFDLSPFREVLSKEILSQNTYKRADFRDVEIGEKVHSEFGFILTSRIAPRFFKGMLFRDELELTKFSKSEKEKQVKKWIEERTNFNKSSLNEENELIEKRRENYIEMAKYAMENDCPYLTRRNEETNSKIVQKIVNFQKQVFKDRTDLYFPVYDVYGDLWWPERMRSEEIKSFTEERDKNISKK